VRGSPQGGSPAPGAPRQISEKNKAKMYSETDTTQSKKNSFTLISFRALLKMILLRQVGNVYLDILQSLA
jgi:hypothetical protein